jgi:hypothetical protein
MMLAPIATGNCVAVFRHAAMALAAAVVLSLLVGVLVYVFLMR